MTETPQMGVPAEYLAGEGPAEKKSLQQLARRFEKSITTHVENFERTKRLLVLEVAGASHVSYEGATWRLATLLEV